MKVIVITDDCQGMLFNNRRQSKDKMLRKEIINLCKNKILYMNGYSYHQFESSEKEEVMIRISEFFLRDANVDAGKNIENCIDEKTCVSIDGNTGKETNDDKEAKVNKETNDNAGKNVYDDGYCFVENEDLTEYMDDINEIVLFKWNTKYPADMYFNIDLNKFRLVSTKDFQGNSHNKITMEIYKR